ncbi:16S rRNA (uracil(1498)-N(3))-methyltransferase [Aquihabitans sp. G128]|uniref:RsmE family RNA methyltransferase n=1 Tax=Aquihabitans sp. G128 TaxID=2849779 RepID=UPI001C237075|nr:RsmE family RNA methyltransferase [Aquihabitans sp. G128]QXC61553.1 16S rRNA (uracil(1498)-N(3))-methyltransferase [Aquihabitans sp. G128]
MVDLARPTLDDGDLHHLSRALRLRPGDPLVLSDGVGGWRRARFAGAEPEVDGEPVAAPRPAPPVEVAFALVKGTKPELAVQKLTELGVDAVRPFVAARSVVRWDAARSESALARLRRVAREAAMQSRRAWLPEVHPVASFAEVAADPRACRADRGGAAPSLDRPLVLTGPEGGWDDAERAFDLPTVALADGVLRAETAAITAGALLVALRAALVLPA